MRTVLIAICAVFASALSLAQTFTNQPGFEVASVKQSSTQGLGKNPECHGGPGTSDPGLLTCTNMALAELVCRAYNLQFFELDSPEWTLHGGSADGYDIAAKIPAGTTKEQSRLMLQKLLAERFHLAVHRGSKIMPHYVLVLGKGAPKIAPSSGPKPPGPPLAMTIVNGHIRWAMHNMPLASFIGFLNVPLSAPVTDETGLQGNYDFTLDFMPDARYRGFDYLPAATEKEFVPDLFQAIQDKLGLKLEARKGPVPVLIVDRAEKVPTEN